MNITLDRQVTTDRCAACDCDFVVVRGSAYDDGAPIGIYLIALHGHSTGGPLAHIAVALLRGTESGRHPVAAALDVFATGDEFCFSVVDWAASPWKGEAYLGTMLERLDVLTHSMKNTFLHVAQHVATDLPEVQLYFSGGGEVGEG